MTGKLPTVADPKAKSLANLRKGGGRPKGIPNKVTADVKAMILGALTDAGGQDYLKKQAILNPGPFMSLLGKVLPSEIKADVKGALTINVVSDFPTGE